MKTREQINNIIDFLEKQLAVQTVELKKYESTPYKKLGSFVKVAIQTTKDNINNTIKTIEYYKALKSEYAKKGLI